MSSSIACIVYKNGNVLVALRQPGGEMGERWEFPGGKIDEGEDAFDAIVREMNEEFGCKATPKDKICSASFFHKGKSCDVTAYEVSLDNDGIEKRFVLTEHTDYKWVPFSDIPSMKFVDSDLSLYPEILEYIKKRYEK